MKVRSGLGRDEQGVGQVVSLIVAGAIFLAAVATVLVVSQGAARDVGMGETAKRVEAASLADLLVGSAGVGWTSDPDTVARLGLLAGNGSGLDAESLEALRGAMADAQDNGKVDYAEALSSLGMDPEGTAGFHLRIYPVGLDDLAVSEDLRIAYIADWTSLVSVKVALPVGSSDAMAVKANAQLNATMFASTVYERQAIRSLGMDFNDRVYITALTPTILVDYAFPLPDLPLLQVLNIPLLEGDVYPDDKNYLEAVLPDRLGQYDVIVVGSGVDHANLVKNSIKDGVRDWVLDGGTLIVLGSADKSTAWLNPLLNVGVDTVNGAPTAPDIAHPLLKEPNDLAWTSYDSHGQGWDIQDSGAVAAYEDFSHVIIQDGEDVLAVSKQAAFGEGRVILTSYHARDIAGAMSPAEASAFLENMITYADRSGLYLDYGGTVPADQPVALAVRQSWLWDEVYGQVPVRVEVLAWG
ncbi:MAG: hypothetical protein ACYC2H_07540 [Thermoplasmatota archaeon]